MSKLKAIVVACLLGATVITSCQKESVSPTETTKESTTVDQSSSERTANDIVETRPAILKGVTTSVTANIHGYYRALPARYDSTTKKYPLLIVMHGKGEIGNGSTGLSLVLKNGTAALLKAGKFPPNFVVNGQNFSFIVVMPQLSRWPTADDVNGMINFAKSKYRVDTSRIYVSGLSMGGGGTWLFAEKYPSRAAAIVTMAGAQQIYDKAANLMATTNLPIWAFHNTSDPTVPSVYSKKNVTMVNSHTPATKARLTLWTAAVHDCWTKASNPTYKENNLNIYQWMLQYKR